MSDSAFDTYWRKLTVIASLLLIVAPPLFLYVIYLVKPGIRPTFDAFPSWLYIVYAMPIFDIVSHLLVKKSWRKSLKVIGPYEDTFAVRFRRFVIIRMSKPTACYCYGIVIFFLTGETKQMYYFYAFGIFMTPFAWPRKREYFDFLSEAQAP